MGNAPPPTLCCFVILATPSPQRDPTAATLHYQINLFGPLYHATKKLGALSHMV